MIESNLRSLISYKFSEKYPENFSYLQIENYNCSDYKKSVKNDWKYNKNNILSD